MNLSTLIDAQTLSTRIRAGDVLVVDCRFELADPAAGAREYAQGHIPGAVYASLDDDLSDLSKTGLGRHPLPDATAFSASLSRWGWAPDTPVVAYDAANGALAAARLWWMLRLVGAREAAVLDGGIAAWTQAGFTLESGVATRKPTRVDTAFDAAQIVYTDALVEALKDARKLLIDARAAPRFRGENETMDKVAGHIPGALNRPFADNLDAHGRFKPAAQLRAEFEALLGSRRSVDAIHSCGSGVTACHNLLAMEHAGLAGSRVYAPSWSGWSADPVRPVATNA
ncbi:MAG: sulfurtransferase [Xanthomonadales bacterium PRO7]|nr:sulfurtransferase [Xanthomonadales bacterium PRO7]